MIPNNNIFSEIYNKTNSTYLEYNIFRKLDDVSVSNKKIYDKDMNETGKLTPEVVYKSRVLPDGYSDVSISFNLHDREKGLTIWFYKNTDGSRYLWFLTRYNVENKRLEKKVFVRELKGKALEDTDSEIKNYLAQHNISSSDLNRDYQAIVENLILKDWCSIYDSKFSPTDYGDVTVKTQWENW